MNVGFKTSEFWLLAIVIVGVFALIGIGKLPADMTTLGALLAAVFGYGAQRVYVKTNTNGNTEGGAK